MSPVFPHGPTPRRCMPFSASAQPGRRLNGAGPSSLTFLAALLDEQQQLQKVKSTWRTGA
jgi:hypothetical protein